MTTEMKLSQAGASVAISLAAYGVMFGMDPFEAVEAAEGVLRAACEQHDPARGRKVIRMLGDVPVVEVMVAMGEIIDAQGPLRAEFEDDDPPDHAEAKVDEEIVHHDEGGFRPTPADRQVDEDPVEGAL